MKIKVLSRNPDDHLRESNRDIHKVHRNYNPALHPLETPREYVRALNATKLERVFAKPFLASLDGHRDGVCSMCKHKKRLNTLFSGSCDGEVRQWTLSSQRCIRSMQAHNGFVRGMTCSHDGDTLLTIGDDRTIKHWSTNALHDNSDKPLGTIVTKNFYTDIDHNWKDSIYATCGDSVDIWNYARSEPVKTFEWGSDTVNSVQFNPIETNLCVSTIADRSISLYDIRASVPVNKVVLRMRSNKAVWNPMEAFIFTAANEDYGLYTFDLRNLSYASCVHSDHVRAVLDVDYSPTGKEFVSGSYDRTIRIYPVNSQRSREIYHTRRMQKIFSVKWSADSRYILSGSDETNVRLWKARASEKLGRLAPREKIAAQYNEKLKAKFAHHPQIRRIAKHRHVPRYVFTERLMKIKYNERTQRKQRNILLHNGPDKLKRIPYNSKSILGVDIGNEVEDDEDEA